MQTNNLSRFLFITLVTLFVSGLLYTINPQTVNAEDWLTGWIYRKKITIDHTNVDADLTDFPLLVKITSDSDLSTALSNGYDIRFTSQDGTTLLKYERESYSGGGGLAVTAVIWVKVPSISATTNTDIYMYYGKADAEDGQDATNVWDSNFKGVYHLKEATGVNNVDSTNNGNTGTPTNGPIQTAGKVGGALSFDGQNDYLNIGNTGNYDFTNAKLTYSAWVNISVSTGISNTLLAKYKALPNRRSYFINIENTGLTWFISNNGNPDWVNNRKVSTSGVITDLVWIYISVVVDGSSVKFYVNDSFISSATTGASTIYDAATTQQIGGNSNDNSGFFNGLIDEVRLSDSARTAEWIKFEYSNMNESDNELSFALQQHAPAPTPTNLTATVNLSTISLTVDSFPNHNISQSGYFFESSTGNNSGWIQTNTWQETDLHYGKEYTYTVKYRNGDAIETSTISTTQSTPFASFGTIVIQPQKPPTPPTTEDNNNENDNQESQQDNQEPQTQQEQQIQQPQNQTTSQSQIIVVMQKIIQLLQQMIEMVVLQKS